MSVPSCRVAVAAVILALPSVLAAQSEVFTDSFEGGDVCSWSTSVPAGQCVVVSPERIDDVLTNPGMGFADFHFGWWCNLPPITFTPEECAGRVEEHWPVNYPDAGTAYFRWLWRELEPVRGEIDFDLIDAAIQSANLLGETLSFRVMTIQDSGDGVGLPDWLLEDPYNVPGEWWDGIFWPDYRNSVLQAEHERFVAALGERYNGHPGLDHVDIGSVGCWGEWNTACLDGAGGIFGVFHPVNDADRQVILAAYQELIDHWVEAFADSPAVMLGLGGASGGGTDWELETMLYATGLGTGWRVDCWGDWGFWGGAWNHMEDLYPPMISAATAEEPSFADLWQTAPIQLEICGTIQQWHDFGWSAEPPDGEVFQTFQWALDQHASVLNGKFGDIPGDYVAPIDDLLRENGYRFVVDSFRHSAFASPGNDLVLRSTWSNLGVAPIYNPRTLSYRLRGESREEVFASPVDVRTWLPGSWQVVDTLPVPADIPAGDYVLEVALLDRPGSEPATLALAPIQLGIEGRQPDGWYLLSQITVQ